MTLGWAKVLGYDTKSMTHEKIDKLDFVKIKNIGVPKTPLRK